MVQESIFQAIQGCLKRHSQNPLENQMITNLLSILRELIIGPDRKNINIDVTLVIIGQPTFAYL